MTMTAVDIDGVVPIRRGEEPRALAVAAYQSLLEQLEDLEPADWETPTVCEPWTVADVVRHLVGSARACASVREFARQQFLGGRRRSAYDGNALDATNALQVAEHSHLGPGELVAQLRAWYPRAVRGRMSKPALLDRVEVSLAAGGSTAVGMPDRLSLGHLFRVILTRDVWLHRIDIARALGRGLPLERQVDGRIVEDVVREWAARHGQPFDLVLSGPLAARYARPGEGPRMEMDAIELCWILSGRGDPAPGTPGAELLAGRVLF
ncbi:MAG: maleylpyruvate isomerase family mycothiol-dependent enzyme [Actinomycetota bacterium]